MLISNAYAQAAGAAADPTGGMMPMLMIAGMFGLMYFMVIRPQQKRAKELKAMIDALAKGDEVVTQGGVAGKVASVGDHYIRLEVAPDTELTVQRAAVSQILPKGTLKNA